MSAVAAASRLSGGFVPILRQGELEIISSHPEQTERLGASLGRLLHSGDRICLSGDIGAGKTVFSRGIGAGWGAAVPLTSPSYNLVHAHQRPVDAERLYHLDFYRVGGAEEAELMGLDDILDSKAVAVFEWPERIQDILPRCHLWIDIKAAAAWRRHFVFEARGRRYETLVDEYRQSVFGSR